MYLVNFGISLFYQRVGNSVVFILRKFHWSTGANFELRISNSNEGMVTVSKEAENREFTDARARSSEWASNDRTLNLLVIRARGYTFDFISRFPLCERRRISISFVPRLDWIAAGCQGHTFMTVSFTNVFPSQTELSI